MVNKHTTFKNGDDWGWFILFYHVAMELANHLGEFFRSDKHFLATGIIHEWSFAYDRYSLVTKDLGIFLIVTGVLHLLEPEPESLLVLM